MKLSTIIDYIKATPYNTNPAILQQLLQEYIDHPEKDDPKPTPGPTPGPTPTYGSLVDVELEAHTIDGSTFLIKSINLPALDGAGHVIESNIVAQNYDVQAHMVIGGESGDLTMYYEQEEGFDSYGIDGFGIFLNATITDEGELESAPGKALMFAEVDAPITATITMTFVPASFRLRNVTIPEVVSGEYYYEFDYPVTLEDGTVLTADRDYTGSSLYVHGTFNGNEVGDSFGFESFENNCAGWAGRLGGQEASIGYNCVATSNYDSFEYAQGKGFIWGYNCPSGATVTLSVQEK